MSLRLAEIVSATTAPSDEGSKARALSRLRVRPTRRTVLRAMVASGLAVGGSFLSWGSRLTAPDAHAETSPNGSLEGWNKCGGVNYRPMRDSAGAYVDWQPACLNSAGYISRHFCNRNGWHRRDRLTKNGVRIDYDAVSNRCWGNAKSRNSWRWKARKDPDPELPLRTFRCSDGRMTRCSDAHGCHTFKTVCRFMV